jgi:mannose-6-phosphate isomerase-like protein (cupin superfamily)
MVHILWGKRSVEVFKNTRELFNFATAKMQKVNLFETTRMFCDIYCFEPGQEQTAHAHAGSDKVYYVIEGRGRVRVDEAEQEVSAGHAVFAPAGSTHGVRNPGPQRLAMLVFMAPKPA